jgi:hypothetical protein
MRDMIFRPGPMKPGIDQRRLSKGGKKGEQNNMKRKFVLRLLAAVMAVSLTATSVPSSLLSTVETVYAASAADKATLDTTDFAVTASTISVKKSDSNLQYGVVKSGTGDSSTLTSSDWKNDSTGNQVFEIANGLNAYTSYDVYSATDTDGTGAKYLCTVTTEKISLSNSATAAIATVDLDGDKTADDLTSKSVTYNGKAQEPTVLTVTVPKDGAASGTDTLSGSEITSNFDITYSNNINVGTQGTANAPTITLTAKKDSKYSSDVSITTTFTIAAFELNDSNTQIKINGAVYGPTNIQSVPFDGTGQDTLLSKIEVSAKLDSKSDYVTLKRGVDYDIDFAAGKSSNTTSIDNDGLNVTTDAGTVKLVFKAVTGSNFKDATTPVSAQFSITKSTPATPSAPTVYADSDLSIVIDTSDEDARYTYQYLILTEDDLKKEITWPSTGVITSAAVGGSVTDKASKITVTTSNNATSAVSNDASATTVNNLKRMDGTTALALQSSTKYYVVRRILESDNVKGSYTSAKTEVTTKKVALASVVKSTNYKDGLTAATADNNAKISGFDKTYDAEDQDDVPVVLYVAIGKAGSSLKEGTDYTIEYYNVPTAKDAVAVTDGSTYAKSVANGRKGDKKSAGTVYVWAVANDVNYSGALLIGKYTISPRDITLKVESTSKDYDGTDAVYGLKATGIYKTDTVTVEGLKGVALTMTVGTWGISSKDSDLTAVNNVTTYSENASNYNIQYDVSAAKVEIKKATVEITGSNITIAYGQKLTLDIKTNVEEVSKVLTYTLSYGSGSDVETYLDLQSSTGVATLELKDYAAISKATNLKVIASLQGVKDTDNYVIGTATSKEFTVTINPARIQVGFSKDTDYDGVITLPSYTRRTEVQKAVETADDTALSAAETNTFEVGIDATGTANASKKELKIYDGAGYYVAPGSTTYPNVVYKYYKADGVTELYDIPTEDGTYVVKAYLKATDDYKGNVIGTDGSDSSDYSGTIKLVIGSGKSSSSSTGSSEGVADYYENADDGKVYDKNDNLVTNKVVNLDGTDKYVGSDGKVVTGKVLVDDAATGNTYAIAKDGSLIKNTKTTIGGKDYVTDANGAILKDQLATTPSGNTVYVGKDGAVVKNKVVTVGKAKYYANASGRIVKNGFFTTKAGNTVYATASGKLKYGKVFTVGKYKYFAKKSGVIAKSGIFETPSGNKVRATKTGKLYVSTTFTYKGVTYKASKNGVLKVVK